MGVIGVERYTIEEEPVGKGYSGLLRFALGRCDAGLLVVRDADAMTPMTANFLGSIKQSIISNQPQSRWPGTELIGHTATVFRFRYDDMICDQLTKATDHLYGWIEPELPEDLCLMRPGGSPWLVTISHEHDGYLDLNAGEFHALVPEVPIRLIREDPR